MMAGVALTTYDRLADERSSAATDAAGIRSGICKKTGLLVSLRPLSASAGIEEAWRDLASRVLERNIFYEPEFAVPAGVPFGRGVLLLAAHPEGREDALLGLWPVRIQTARWGLPFAVILGWSHPFAATGVPLLDRKRANEALEAVLSAPGTLGRLPSRGIFPLIPDEGPFGTLLDEKLSGAGSRQARTEAHDRAYLVPAAEEDPLAHLSSGSRSKLRQERRRLEKLGSLTMETCLEPDKIDDALRDYLRLEESGWKGRAGTAITSSAEETHFMVKVVRDLAAEGRVRIHRLVLDGRTIASSITYLNGDHAWYAKISFDEEFAKNSPGSQLVVMATEAFNTDETVNFVDSCAPAGHPLMRRFWSARMGVSTRVVELGRDPLHPLAARLERLRPVLRDRYKSLRGRISFGR